VQANPVHKSLRTNAAAFNSKLRSLLKYTHVRWTGFYIQSYHTTLLYLFMVYLMTFSVAKIL
jgi:hypothetical protein